MSETKKDLHIGIVGAGIGGLTAAIAIVRAGAKVTVLEAAEELGEIGAGIQMTPNASRLLQRYGVARAIGPNLVAFEALHMRRRDGHAVGYTSIPRIEAALAAPWWLVQRHHLHRGLAATARAHGVALRTGARVEALALHAPRGRVAASTAAGAEHAFDLLLGADGVHSAVRRALFPGVRPRAPTPNAAFRAVVPYTLLEADEEPAVRAFARRHAMEVWMAERRYVIAYPISAGRDCNLVLSHHVQEPVEVVEDVDVREVRERYADFDVVVVGILEKVKLGVQRWPLLVTGPLESWSSPRKNVVLMGDAAHSMTNHMAQGAATSMEDGAFLGILISEWIRGRMTREEVVHVYESERMPKAKRKQDVSFLTGAIWQLSGEDAHKRDQAMMQELQTPDAPEGKVLIRSPNLYGDPAAVLEVYGYDVEDHARDAVKRFLSGGKEVRAVGGYGKLAYDQIMGWFLNDPPAEDVSVPKSKI